jgi:hypothetical protein
LIAKTVSAPSRAKVRTTCQGCGSEAGKISSSGANKIGASRGRTSATGRMRPDIGAQTGKQALARDPGPVSEVDGEEPAAHRDLDQESRQQHGNHAKDPSHAPFRQMSRLCELRIPALPSRARA